VFNEDDHFDFEKPANNFVAAVRAGASWGYFDFRMKDEGFAEGYQSVPVNPMHPPTRNVRSGPHRFHSRAATNAQRTRKLAIATGKGQDFGLAAAITIIIFLIVATISAISFSKTKALENLA